MQNKTYFSFRQSSDWQNGILNNLEFDQHGLRLMREQRYRHSKRITFQAPTDLDQWLDAFEAEEGWYWLNNQNQIYRFEKQFRHRELVLKLELDEEDKAYRLAVKGELLFVLTYNEKQLNVSHLYCFYLSNGQLRWKQEQWKHAKFIGYSLAVTSAESIVILAQLDTQEELYLLQLDALGYPMHELVISSLTFEPSLMNEVNKWNQAYRLVGDEHKVYLFNSNEKQMISYNSTTQQIKKIALSPLYDDVVVFTVDYSGNLWFVQEQTEQNITELICFNEAGEIVQQGQLSIGACHYLLVSKKMVIVCDIEQKLAYLLEPKQLPLFSESLNGYRGVWISQPLDSEKIGTEWHRLTMATEKQHDTTVNIKYFASDNKKVKLEQLEGLWSPTIEDAKDALFNRAIGRYLWIAIEIIATDLHTPYIKSLEVHFPRNSYVKDLPVIFQRSDQGFLTHYLSLFQTMLEDTDLKIENATRKLEPNQVNQQSLKWLIGWLGLDTDDYWSDEQLRELLKEAPKLFSLRGTKYAIEKLVEIYTGSKPIILEYDDIKPLKENIELGEVVEKLYAADEHTFNVLVKADDVSSELKKVTLQHILDRYKPVFTTCKLVILQPWVYMDLHSYLGMNTFLTAPQQLMLNGQMSMPHHTITLDVGQHNQLDKHSRIGLNSKLE